MSMSMTPAAHIEAADAALRNGVHQKVSSHALLAIAKTLQGAQSELRHGEVRLPDEHPRYGSGDKIPATAADLAQIDALMANGS